MILQEQWKSSGHGSKRKDRSQEEEDGGAHSEKKRRKGGKRRKKDKNSGKSRFETEEAETDMNMMDDHEEEMEYDDTHMNYNDQMIDHKETEHDHVEDTAQDLLAAAGLEDSDADDDMVPLSPSFSSICLYYSY